MRLSEMAKLRGDADPADTCLALMADDGGRISGMFHTMSEDDVRLVMKQPWVSIASDGSAINLEAPGVALMGAGYKAPSGDRTIGRRHAMPIS